MVRCTSDGAYTGDGVEISGFRLIGPHFGTMEGNDNLERGMIVKSCLNVDIHNMEIAGWSGQAIYVDEDELYPRLLNPDAVKIYGNYIHNNQHKGGNGYGVDIRKGAYARIEQNVFDLNRHAIASSGKAGAGYSASENLILRGGGVHDKFLVPYTHLFDVHGDANCPSFISGLFNCGNAGDQYWMYNNTFQYLKDNSIKLRGVPRVAAYIYGNVFAKGSVDDAIELFSSTNVTIGSGAQANIAGYDTYGRYGTCDLDGDGKDDFFLASGKTWWSMSAARMHWVFLKSASERLEKVGFGDFNGDGVCDVVAAGDGELVTSSGGTGPWTSLPGTAGVAFGEVRFADFNGDHKTDVFRRAPNGQWSYLPSGLTVWQNLNNSSFPLSSLRFGDFNGDGIADVLSLAGGRWSVSYGGLSGWTKLNSLSTSLNSVRIADVNGDGKDDIIRLIFVGVIGNKFRWEVSWGGRTAWKTLRTVYTDLPTTNPLVTPRAFVGRFSGTVGADMLLIDYRRKGWLFDYKKQTVVKHNLFPY